MSDEPPETLTTEQVKSCVDVGAKTEMVVVGERIYKREGKVWRLLDNGPTQGNG